MSRFEKWLPPSEAVEVDMKFTVYLCEAHLIDMCPRDKRRGRQGLHLKKLGWVPKKGERVFYAAHEPNGDRYFQGATVLEVDVVSRHTYVLDPHGDYSQLSIHVLDIIPDTDEPA